MAQESPILQNKKKLLTNGVPAFILLWACASHPVQVLLMLDVNPEGQ